MARNHIRGYLESGRFEIVALADLHESAMDEVDRDFSISPTHYTDARKMMEDAHPDVVSIGTWHSGHPEWTIAAASYQPKAILCEKPMADTPGRAEQMLIACNRNDVKLAIAHQRRFLPAYTLARQMIAEGAIGDVQWMTAVGAQGLPNYCTHQTDMFRYLLSDDTCTWVMGNIERKTDRWERNTRIEDSAEAVFQFAGGARANIICDLGAEVYQGAKIYGSDGLIDLTVKNLQILNASTSGKWETHQPEGRWAQPDEPRFEYHEAGVAQAEELANWVEDKIDVHRGESQHGYQALQMIHAIYESARCHERVVLPLQTRLNPLDVMIDSGHLTPERPGKYEIRATRLRGEGMDQDNAVT
jgi:predicted dehydrogenase